MFHAFVKAFVVIRFLKYLHNLFRCIIVYHPPTLFTVGKTAGII